MCVDYKGKILTLEKSKTFYKIVRKNRDKFYSQFSPGLRGFQERKRGIGPQDRWKYGFGRTVCYEIGKKAKSLFSESFGLYCLTDKKAALESARRLSYLVLSVRVPKGTLVQFGKYRIRGESGKSRSVEAAVVECFIPIREVTR